MPTGHETYPMAMFAQLSVSDLDTSVEWCHATGFEAGYAMPVMARFGIARTGT